MTEGTFIPATDVANRQNELVYRSREQDGISVVQQHVQQEQERGRRNKQHQQKPQQRHQQRQQHRHPQQYRPHYHTL